MIFLRLLSNLVRLLLWPLTFLRWNQAVPKDSYLSFTIRGVVLDIVPRRRLWEMRTRPAFSLQLLTELIDAVLQDPRVKGVVVTLESFGGGMATATSLRAELARLRAGGKEVVIVLPMGGDTKELYVATAGTRILVGPQSTLSPLGFAASMRYVKGALEKLGVQPDVLARGEFKSAGEQLVRDGMSDAQRTQLEALFEVLYHELISSIAIGRGIDKERAKELVDCGPYRAEAAKAKGLIDGTAYEDMIPTILGTTEEPAKLVPAEVYAGLLAALELLPLRRRGNVGVIFVHGAITMATPGPFGAAASDEKLISAIRAARQSRRVKGVILHIDSPGGSALASDRIHHELVQLAAEKPLVACMANVAASGGYYVAAAAHEIVAQPTTVTGSIGVVAARIVVAPLLAKLGIVTQTVKRGARADMMDPSRPFTEDERAALNAELEGMYGAFVGIVAQGRKLPVDAVEKVAEGRVWSGADAKERGLVDELGGFDVALDRVRARIGGVDQKELLPVVIRGARKAGAPLPPPTKAAAELVLRALDLEAIWAEYSLSGTERVLMYSSLAHALK